jgi:hypothetical protein
MRTRCEEPKGDRATHPRLRLRRGIDAPALALAATMFLWPSGFVVAACTSSACDDAPAVSDVRASLAAECGCASAGGAKRYVGCAKSHVKSLIELRHLPAACRKPIMRCERHSTCGRPTAVACCETTRRGRIEGRIVREAATCHGLTCPSARSARAACTSDGRCLSDFDGSSAGETRTIAGIELTWCPAGSFMMGSRQTSPSGGPTRVRSGSRSHVASGRRSTRRLRATSSASWAHCPVRSAHSFRKAIDIRSET